MKITDIHTHAFPDALAERAMKKLRPTVTDYQRTVNGVLSWCYVGIGMVAKEEA